jgi:hypothetical protein
MRNEISALLEKVGEDYATRGVAEMEIYRGHDIHAYYILNSDPAKIIHVQSYPGMSDRSNARVYARMMNAPIMRKIREDGSASIGNEHEAVTERFANFGNGILIPYDAKVLEDLLEENVPELKTQDASS